MADLSGPKGESLFSSLEWWCVDPERFPSSLIGPVLEVVRHLPQETQDRLLVLLGALLVEGAVDEILKAVLPGFRQLDDTRDVSFAVKTEIVRAMRLCPAKFLDAADTVRGTRNDFAHNLTVDSLGKVPKRVASVRQALKRLRPESDVDRKTDADAFRGLVTVLVPGLWLYAEMIRVAFEFLRGESFMATFRTETEARFAPAWAERPGDIRKLYDALRGVVDADSQS